MELDRGTISFLSKLTNTKKWCPSFWNFLIKVTFSQNENGLLLWRIRSWTPMTLDWTSLRFKFKYRWYTQTSRPSPLYNARYSYIKSLKEIIRSLQMNGTCFKSLTNPEPWNLIVYLFLTVRIRWDKNSTASVHWRGSPSIRYSLNTSTGPREKVGRETGVYPRPNSSHFPPGHFRN